MAAPALNLEQYQKNYGCGIPSWSPLYHEDPEPAANPNMVGGVLLPPNMRTVDQDAISFGLNVLSGKDEKGNKTKSLGWSKAETAEGCRIRDYGSGVPHWSPLYGGSEWRKEENKQGQIRYKNFRTGEVTEKPSDNIS
ncbi:hypothetical protein ScalyP_jg11469 [Parmales sp. scaly parma]|nr:hypothetical protein ScalyP_jg11469 [Parmales sp. scaly parma]